MSVTYKLVGMKAVLRKVDKLPAVARKRVMRKGVNAGAQLVLKAARRLAPVDEGGLKKSLRKKSGRFFNDATSYMDVIPAAPHAHLVEFGTVERETKTGASRGVMPAQPFMRPALDENVDAVVFVMRGKMETDLPKEWAKL